MNPIIQALMQSGSPQQRQLMEKALGNQMNNINSNFGRGQGGMSPGNYNMERRPGAYEQFHGAPQSDYSKIKSGQGAPPNTEGGFGEALGGYSGGTPASLNDMYGETGGLPALNMGDNQIRMSGNTVHPMDAIKHAEGLGPGKAPPMRPDVPFTDTDDFSWDENIQYEEDGGPPPISQALLNVDHSMNPSGATNKVDWSRNFLKEQTASRNRNEKNDLYSTWGEGADDYNPATGELYGNEWAEQYGSPKGRRIDKGFERAGENIKGAIGGAKDWATNAFGNAKGFLGGLLNKGKEAYSDATLDPLGTSSDPTWNNPSGQLGGAGDSTYNPNAPVDTFAETSVNTEVQGDEGTGSPRWGGQQAIDNQQMLVDAGYDIGNTGEGGQGVDGQWGPKSEKAWNQHQVERDNAKKLFMDGQDELERQAQDIDTSNLNSEGGLIYGDEGNQGLIPKVENPDAGFSYNPNNGRYKPKNNQFQSGLGYTGHKW